MAAANSSFRGPRGGRFGLVVGVDLLDVKLGLALVRRERRQHDVDVAPYELRLGVRVAHAGQVGDRLLHHLEPELRVSHLATPELEAQLHLVAVVEELLRVPELGVEVVRRYAGGELDLLDLARRRLRVGRLLRLLVDILAEIHDPADRRGRVRRDLDQVQPDLKGEVHRLGRVQDPELLALRRDHANLRDLDAVVAAYVRERIVVAALILSAWTVAAWGGRRSRYGHQ